MTAKAKKTKTTDAELLSEIKRVYQAPLFTDAEQDRILRSQCLALACSMACENDGADDIIRAAKQCFDWIKDATVPQKANIRAVP